MFWVTLIIKTDAAHAELLSDILIEQGALSADIHDAAADTDDEQMLFGEPGEICGEIWQNAEVSALFDQNVDIEEIVRDLTKAAQFDRPPSYRVERVEEQDWVQLTQSQFDPIQISSRLWIVHTWHQSPDPAAINLILDPGMAFGTGSHPTTKLCLNWLDQHIRNGDVLIDYGCGSGILAIAALKLGAQHVTGIDIDPQAINASEENALRNHCNSSDFEFITADTERALQLPGSADIVVANILANPLILLAPLLSNLVRSGGRIALSGILSEQADDVNSAYQSWFDMSIAADMEGWVLLTGIKR
ncbi:MAG: 50S ribosomal protein L11 methyltransferase [Nitrosomonas sp.]|nr:50S ribosomal protein L11 methyltransferase [Nitrosomonas sp.]